ncbi:nucleoside deaminase [Candidatus Planktophila versatilis]|uniref:tRNA-specific adenosine deaminase n=1 Tax=Candidatus Planktophila versatilis TaxID=1884905 RepID=A0ABN5BGJ4_9ACTN|nr:nucleoside deaminase [Candidatus Planktophila versatilis]ASY17802.1 tRNA(adenine34) deaminase [Candidatus Planktophila versatilis]ASY26922.1 tRNA(adenine34) deaminase [Candidatus Planktophila versatilis]
MGEAIAIAHDAVRTGDVPVGAIVLNKDGIVIGIGSNEREANNDPTAHAEVVAIRNAASRLQNSRLDGCTLVVTLEPCAMCAGAIAQSRISQLIFGAWDEKAGAVGSVWDLLRDPRSIFSVEVTAGVREAECAQLLKDFFSDK